MKRIIQRVAAVVIGVGFGAAALAGLESVTHISDLNSSWPLGSDLASTSDDHIRNIKVALKTDFPNINAAVTGTPAQLNSVTGAVGGSAITWTGKHTFTPASGRGIDINANANQYGMLITGNSTSGQSFGLDVLAGTTASDAALNVSNQSGTRSLFGIAGNGNFTAGNTTDNPTYSFLGTGTATFGGAVTATGAVTGSNFSGFANPSGSTGLTAVNGSAITAMRSDAAPAISQSITPTWSAQHVFTKNGVGSSAAVYLNQATNPFIAFNQSASAADNRLWDFGADAGTLLLRVVNDAVTVAHNILVITRSGAAVSSLTFGNATDNPTFNVLGTGLATFNGSAAVVGGMVMGAPTGGNQGAGTLNAGGLFVNGVAVTTGSATTTGTFTGTFNGFTAGVTATCTWTKTGNTVTLFIPATANGTSNATTFNMTGLPAAIQPATLTQGVAASGNVVNNGVIASLPTAIFQAASGTVPFHTAGGPSNWANTGTKGFSSVGTSFTYSVQ